MSEAVFLTIVGLVLGSTVTAVVAWFFYVRAAKDLKDAAMQLNHTSALVLAFLQNQDAKPRVEYDEHGFPKTVVVSANMVP